jgi:two-component system sensor histidine kinase AlgZ
MANNKRLLRGFPNNIFTHVLVWTIILSFPLFFFDRRNEGINWSYFWNAASTVLCFIVVFYVNYLYLIEKFLFDRKTKEFILINLILIVALAALMHFAHELVISLNYDGRPPMRMRGRRPKPFFPLKFIFNNAFFLTLVAGLSVAIKMSMHWVKLDNERKELEKAKTEAELQNLKSQINPHFLLNTLNNIYALINFNPVKAQQAVQDLSKLLRHVLYDNNQTFVSLLQEVEFMQNYIELMRIRLAENVKLTTKFNLISNSNTKIAPLTFISLIENAFKHGISGDKPSYIYIELIEKQGAIVQFSCKNSYFPKTDSDKSGKGIGLEQLQKRLDLLYPGHYIYDTEIKNNEYSAILIINTNIDIENDTQLLDH